MKQRDPLFSSLFLLFLLFIASFFIPFPVVLNVIAMGLLVVGALLYGKPAEKIQLLKERKHIWFMLAFAAMLLVSFLLSSNHASGLRALQLRIPLLLFPLSVGLLRLRRVQRNNILLSMAIIVTLACLACLCRSVYLYQKDHNEALLYNDSLSSLIGQQSIYTSILVNLSIYIFGWFLFYVASSTWKKILLFLAILFLFVISYLLASRNMMLILYATTILFAFYSIIRKRRYLEGVTLLVALFIVGFLFYKFFPKTINRFRELAYTQFSYNSQGRESHYAGVLEADQWNGANFRLAAWHCGLELFKEHPVFGVGLGDKKDELFKKYEQKQFQFAITTRKNVHNNYLDILFSLGVAGLILFILGWVILPFIRLAKSRDGLGILILLTFALAMLTENYFDRGIGAMLFGFFIPFLLAERTREN
ncbi:MAG TPA: O-antigen ligase family protein [Chitinophagaceae bacterium]|nr:O-antigen ligase family protein [Chitinophagaceae bacterium]